MVARTWVARYPSNPSPAITVTVRSSTSAIALLAEGNTASTEEQSAVTEQIVASLLNGAWDLITFLAVPVIGLGALAVLIGRVEAIDRLWYSERVSLIGRGAIVLLTAVAAPGFALDGEPTQTRFPEIGALRAPIRFEVAR